MRWLVVVVLAVIAGILVGRSFETPVVATPTVIERLRAVARLQVLDVTVSRQVTLNPEPTEQRTFAGSLAQWARYAIAPPSGTALVGGEAHFQLDLSHLDARSVRVEGDAVQVVLP